jgi:adenosylhomocysteinase
VRLEPTQHAGRRRAALVAHYGISTFAIKGEDHKTYYSHIVACIEARPHVTMDDGCDLVTVLHTKMKPYLRDVFAGHRGDLDRRHAPPGDGGAEGAALPRDRDQRRRHQAPVRQPLRHRPEHDGRGHSRDQHAHRGLDGRRGRLRHVRAWRVARAKGLGATVLVTEINPVRALEAAMDGFQVVSMEEAAPRGDLFITVTGNKSVLRREHFMAMKDGAIVANSGHFNVEIDIPALERLAIRRREVRTFVDEYKLKGGTRVHLLGEGRLINLAAAEGHPAMVMDMSFANQALCVEFLRKKSKTLKKDVYVVPSNIDRQVARLKLATMRIDIDTLTPEQDRYMRTWSEGT